MRHPTIRLLIAVAVNAGGEGKSTIAEMLLAIAHLLGLKTAIIGADPGNGAIRHAIGRGDDISWGAKNEIVPAMLGHYDDANVVVLDAGANGLTEHSTLAENIRRMFVAGRTFQRDPYLFVPLSPNKSGAGAGADSVLQSFANCATTLLVRNDRDGSSNFEETKASTAIQIPYLEPGFIAARKGRKIDLDRVIREPVDGYQLSSGQLALWLKALADNKHIRSMFRIEGDFDCLDGIENPGPLMFQVRTERDACDEMLQLNHACHVARHDWLQTRPSDPSFAERSTAFHALLHRWLRAQ